MTAEAEVATHPATIRPSAKGRALKELGLPGETFPQMVARRAELTPTQTYMRHKRLGIWQRYTWRDVWHRVLRLARGLAALGVRRGDCVGLIGENEPQLFWAMFSAQALGAHVAVLFPDTVAAELQFVAEDSEACVLIAEDQEQVDKALELKASLPKVRRVVYWDPRCMWQYSDPWLLSFEALEEQGKAVAPEAVLDELARGSADDWACLSYTSGTTGKPRGTILTYRFLVDNALRFMGAVPVSPGAQYLSYISPAWATEQVFGVAMGLVAPLVVNFAEEPETVMADLREIGAELVVLSPRQWESLAALIEAQMLQAGALRQRWYRWALEVGQLVSQARIEGRRLAPGIRLMASVAELTMLAPLRDRLGLSKAGACISAGSAMAPSVFRLFHGIGVLLRNLYGTTEVGLLTMHSGRRFDPETVGAWLSIYPGIAPPLEWRVDPSGELRVRGGTGFQGYFRRPEATLEKFDEEGWFRTGDAVTVRPDGQLVYLDRVVDLRELQSGFKYPPQFIETRLRFSPFIRDAVVLGDRSKPFVAALVDIDAQTVGNWAMLRRISYTTHADLSQKPEVVALVKEEVERVNRNLPEPMRIQRFAILPKPLDPDEAELTRTRKLRRSFLEERYRDLIEALYRGDQEYAPEVPVKYRDGRSGTVRVPIRFCTVESAQSEVR